MEEQRLQKYLANCGVASRRKAEKIIAAGRVSINGAIAASPGMKVTPDSVVTVDGKRVELENNRVYIILNKPAGYICSSNAQFNKKSVLDILNGINERVFTVGRLDYNTTGLLLITNDGIFAQKLIHPGNIINKEYFAEVTGHPSEEDIRRLREGIILGGRKTAASSIVKLTEDNDTSSFRIIIHEGRKRQIRMMFALTGYPVKYLKRTAFGRFTLGDLKEGQWRHLTIKEVDMVLSDEVKQAGID